MGDETETGELRKETHEGGEDGDAGEDEEGPTQRSWGHFQENNGSQRG